MKKIILILTLTIATFNLKAQSIAGDWFGALNVNGTQLRLVFHISKPATDYVTKFDSPDQGANGLDIDKTTVNNNALTIESGTYGFKYVGTYKPDSAIIRGTFTQGPGVLPLLLSRRQPER